MHLLFAYRGDLAVGTVESSACTVGTVYSTLIAFAGLGGGAGHSALAYAGSTDVGVAESCAVRDLSRAEALAADRGSASVTLGAEALAVAVAPLTVVVDLTLAPRALEVALVTAGGTVIDRLLECSRPKCLHRDEHREDRHEEHRRGNDYYSFLCEFHFESFQI